MGTYAKDPLFTAILSNDTEQIKRLRSQGAGLSDEVKSALSINRLSALQNEEALGKITCDFQCSVRPMGAEDFIKTIHTLRDEIGEPLFFMPALWTDIKRIMFEDGVWKCVLDCFDHKMNKARTMRDIIKQDRADILAVCAEHGWLSQPKKRDEMIEYATANGKAECSAFLLDFKNRTADLAAEHVKAEKKAERELNAAPDSITSLKQIWSYKKCEGGIIITGYKGDRTEVIVPEKIGKDTVTAIGDHAFCPFARRTNPDMTAVREAITKITLPDTIRSIGDAAFWNCKSLISVNIPEGVDKIGENTFAECRKLENIIIPKSVKSIEWRAFFQCDSLKFIEVPEGVETIGVNAFIMCDSLITLVLPGSLKSIGNSIIGWGKKPVGFMGIVVPRGSFAEEYCIRHNLPHICKEDKD